MKHIKIKSSEVLHGGKTLDKEIKDINIRIGKIAPDGTKIATKESLGNVIIGDNINVNEKGAISIPIAHPQDETYGLVTSKIYLDNWEDYIQVAMSDDGKLGVPKANSERFGVVMPDSEDFITDQGTLQLSYIDATIPTTNGNLIINAKGKQGTIIQDWEVEDLNDVYWQMQQGFKDFLNQLAILLINGYNFKYVVRFHPSNGPAGYISGTIDYTFNFYFGDYDNFEDFKDAVNNHRADCGIKIYANIYDYNNVLHHLLVANGNLL